MNVILFLFLLSRIWNEIDRFLYLWCVFAISCKGVAALPPHFGQVSLLNLRLGHCTPHTMSQEGRRNEICHCGRLPWPNVGEHGKLKEWSCPRHPRELLDISMEGQMFLCFCFWACIQVGTYHPRISYSHDLFSVRDMTEQDLLRWSLNVEP